MKTLTTQCIILGQREFGEINKLVFFYNDQLGKFKAIAKGARKITSKFTGHLQTLNFCTASFYFGPKNIILTEISTNQNYFKKNSSLKILTGALQIAEITNQMLFEEQAIKGLAQLLQETTDTLSNNQNPDLVILSYYFKLLDQLGLLPDFKTVNTKLSEKYLKFFNYLIHQPLTEIQKIKLSKEEQHITKEFLRKLIQSQTNKKLVHL